METKQNITINAVAQLLGYYYHGGTSQQMPFVDKEIFTYYLVSF